MNRKKESRKQEKKIAKKFNAKVTIGSGCLWFNKADVRNEKFLIECKTTQKSFYRIHIETWEKIYKEAIKDGDRIPLLIIDLLDGEKEYVVFDKGYFVTNTPIYYDKTFCPKSFSVKKDLQIQLFIKGYYCYSIVLENRRPIYVMELTDFIDTFRKEVESWQ